MYSNSTSGCTYIMSNKLLLSSAVTGKMWPKLFEIKLLYKTHNTNGSLESVRTLCNIGHKGFTYFVFFCIWMSPAQTSPPNYADRFGSEEVL